MPKPHIQLEHMRKAVRSLPEPTRTVYCLHLIEELDYLAIAERLEMTLAEVEWRIAEAIVSIDREIRRRQGGAGR
jgi:DNA-directed RNA polymerase specialized sigma24 family protein